MRLAREPPRSARRCWPRPIPNCAAKWSRCSRSAAGGEFLDRPAIQNAPELLEDSTVTGLAAGACLGPYRIESKLGEGGMGEVFRAVDTRLGRAVAIKITHEQFSARFEREARAISSLNHPNICTLHDVGPNYLVMELVEGETIAARLKSGPLPVKTALLYASQIAAALAEAHGKGIIHRDLKPGNIMIAKSGVKVLDFGLAKSGQDETVTASRMVMGTPAYMAPEQREGKPADARSDIYSFGCVLYEMLTGARVGSQRRRIPSRKLEKIVSRCLEEDPGRRWQSAAELERELAASAAASRWTRGAAAADLALSAAATSISIGRRNSPRRTRSSWPNSRTRPAIRCLTARFARAWRCNWSSRRSSTLVSDQQVQQVLRFMSRPPETRLTPEVAQEICERTGGTRGSGRLDCQPRKPVRLVVTRQELPHRRHPRSGAGAGGKKRRGPECAHAGLRFKSGRGWANRWPRSRSTRRRSSRQPRPRWKL